MFSILNRSFKLPQCGHREAAHPCDPQIRMRKSRNATGAEETVALAAGGSILPLSRIETPLQEKAADKS